MYTYMYALFVCIYMYMYICLHIYLCTSAQSRCIQQPVSDSQCAQ